MVTECSLDWLDSQGLLENAICINGSNTLPPVTDRDSGIVYKNEYCAVCNDVTNILPWVYRFECPDCAGENIDLIKSRCPDRLHLIQEIIETDCVTCGFSPPSSGPPARPCFPDSFINSKCLSQSKLEYKTGIGWEMDEYTSIATQCYFGPIQPVALCQDTFFKNQYCAICNGHSPHCLSCPHSSDVISQQYSKDCPVILGCSISIENECDDLTSNRTSRFVRSSPKMSEPIQQYSRESRNRRNENSSEMVCEDSCLVNIPPNIPSSFTVILDVTGSSLGISSSVISTNITIACPEDEVFNPFTHTCRATICPEGFASTKGSCSVQRETTNSNQSNNSNHSVSILCEGYLITLNDSEYELIRNDSLNFGGEMYKILGYYNDLPVICTNFSENGTLVQNTTFNRYSYSVVGVVLTYVGCSLSVIGSAIVLLTYTLFKELRTLPGKILMNVSATILANCLFLTIGVPVASAVEKDGLCEAAAIFLHWLVLSQFFWMSVMSFDLLRLMYRSAKYRPIEKGATANKIFSFYFSIGWGIPLIITAISVILNYTTSAIGYGVDGFCWISDILSFFIVFLIPIILTLLLNTVAFIILLVLLFRASRIQARLKKHKNTSYLRVSICIFSVTGLTWIFGFVAILADNNWAWYVFIILTSTQGLIICVAFVCTKKVGHLYKDELSKPLSHLTSLMSSSRERDGHFTSYLSGSKHVGKICEQEETIPTEMSNRLKTSPQLTLFKIEFVNKKEFETNVIPEQCGETSSTFL